MSRRRTLAVPGRSRAAFLVALLLLTLGLVAALAFEAYRAGRSHRQVAEQVLQDYVRFAAREFARQSIHDLDTLTGSLLSTLACRPPEQDATQALASLADCACGTPLPDAYVRFDPGSAAIVDAAGDLDAATRQEITDALAGVSRGQVGGYFALTRGNRPGLLAWRSFGDDVAVPVHAIVVPAAALTAIVDGILDGRPLLPNTLVEPAGQRSYLAAEIRLADGTSLYRAGADAPAYFRAEEPLEANENSAVRVVASLATSAADRLVIGGLPRSRLPLLAALLGVAGVLGAVATHQLRREHELARLRDAFVSGVSHELRTPLAQIRLFADTLSLGRTRSEEEGRRALAIMQEEAERLSHLVDNVMAFNRSGGAAASVTLAEIALASFVADTIERFAPLVQERGNRFEVAIRRDLKVRADRAAMAQVLTNLLDNAVKYGARGQTVRLAATESAERVRLTIDDEGSGVQRADRSRIWEPFVRGTRSGDAVTGTGIGLSVVRDLMSAMGGRAWSEEAPTGGARFVIELGASGDPIAAAAEPTTAPA